MSNSKLISKTMISPNKDTPRNHVIDTITPHCYVGLSSMESAGGWFAKESAQCSCNYYIDPEGKIILIVDEKDRSWCTSSRENDNRAVTIECASGRTYPYKIPEKTVQSLIKLMADIAERNGMDALKWKADKSLIGHPEKQNITAHRWFANKECPGADLYGRLGEIVEKANALLGNKETDEKVEIVEPEWYRVRKVWSEPKTQFNAYENLDTAINNCPVGYTVYDCHGKALYTNEENQNPYSGAADQIWMGWTKRETGSAGLRCIHGDNGKAYGLQFDYRYGLIPFLKYCVEYNSERYKGFEKFIKIGAGNSNLIYNKELGKLWEELYDAYTVEFELLQYTCAYQQYYVPAKEYVLKHYNLDMDKCHPAVKGTLWSMSFRSGTETGAKKFSGCAGKTNEQILNTVYPTYGNNDCGRWTKTGQWGDALTALKNNIYASVYKDMSKSEPAEKTDEKNTISGGKYIVQCGAFSLEANAIKQAKALQEEGFDAVVKKRSCDWFVQCGVFSKKDNAENLISELKKKGFSAILYLSA